MTMRTALLSLAVLLLAGACGSGNDHPDRPEPPPQGQDPQRPGTGQYHDAHEQLLADSTWRVQSPALTLRYDRGGVMVTTSGDSTTYTDLDGTDQAVFVTGAVGADSLCRATLTIGSDSRHGTARRLRVTPRARYYVFTSDSTTVASVVTP